MHEMLEKLTKAREEHCLYRQTSVSLNVYNCENTVYILKKNATDYDTVYFVVIEKV